MNTLRAIALILSIVLAGCSTPAKTVVAPTGHKTEAREEIADVRTEAQLETDAVRETRDSQAAASLAAISAATEIFETLKEEAAFREAAHAFKAFGVTPKPADLAKAIERTILTLRGARDAVVAAYKTAETESRALLLDLVEKSKQLEAAKAAETKAREEARVEREESAKKLADELARIQASHDKQLAELRDGELKFQARTLTCSGILFAALFGLSAGFGGVAGVKKAWPFLLLALMALGLAQIVSQPWFKWAILGAATIGVVGLGYWIWDHNRTGRLKDEAEKKAVELKKFASSIVPILDQAYDDGSQTTKDVLDTYVFDPLTDKMGDQTKALIHRLRAEAKE